MKALIAVDFTPDSGLGHVRRGLAIGAALSRSGWSVTVANTASGEIDLSGAADGIRTVSGLESGGIDLKSLRADFHACVVDSYEASSDLRMNLAPYLAIDDYYLPLPGAIAVLNSAPEADASRYQLDEKLIGASYALLGEDVLVARESCGDPGFPPRHVYVWLGAAGSAELMEVVTRALAVALPEAEVLVSPVLAGPALSRADPVLPQAGPAPAPPGRPALPQADPAPAPPGRPARAGFQGGASYIAMADMVICAGGVTALEAACLGRPAVALVLAENQRANVTGLASEGTLIEATGSTLEDAIRELGSKREQFAELSRRGRKLVDGHGAERAAEAIGRIFPEHHGGSPRHG